MTKKKDNHNLIDRDIKDRFDYEKKFVLDPNKKTSKTQMIQVTVSIFMVALVVGGLIYTFLSVLGLK